MNNDEIDRELAARAEAGQDVNDVASRLHIWDTVSVDFDDDDVARKTHLRFDSLGRMRAVPDKWAAEGFTSDEDGLVVAARTEGGVSAGAWVRAIIVHGPDGEPIDGRVAPADDRSLTPDEVFNCLEVGDRITVQYGNGWRGDARENLTVARENFSSMWATTGDPHDPKGTFLVHVGSDDNVQFAWGVQAVYFPADDVPDVDDEDSISIDEYQDAAMTTAIYPGRGTFYGLQYTASGLASEAGEVIGAVSKMQRDGMYGPEDETILISDRERLRSELGDVAWFLATTAREADMKLSEVFASSLEKLADRAARGVLGGSGDDR